jgi:hypothetical protein
MSAQRTEQVFIVTMKLVEAISSDAHTGLVAFFSRHQSAAVGDNSYVLRTSLAMDEVAHELRHHIVMGDYFCIFDSKDNYITICDGIEFERMNAVFDGPATGEDIPQPTS